MSLSIDCPDHSPWPLPGQHVHLPYSIEDQCLQLPYKPHEERDDSVLMFAKRSCTSSAAELPGKG